MLSIPSAGPRSTRRAGRTSPLAPTVGILVIAGTLFGLWKVSAGLGPPHRAPISRNGIVSAMERVPGPGPGDDQALAAPGPRLRTGVFPLGEDMRRPRPSDGLDRGVASPDPSPDATDDGPALRRRLATVARSFQTATPDLRGLSDLIRALAHHSTVVERSTERESGLNRGRVRLDGTDLEAEFEIRDDEHVVRFSEGSFDTVRPPFLSLELEIGFAMRSRELTETRATLAFVPNPNRKSLDHIRVGEDLRIGWSVRFDKEGVSAVGVGARVGSDLEAWEVGPSEKRRVDKRIRDLSAFRAWSTLLAGVPR